MDDSGFELEANFFIEKIDNSFNKFEYVEDSFQPYPPSMHGMMYFECPECFDCPRIIFEKEEMKIFIKTYCYSHKKIEIYTIQQFINKFGMTKDKEINQSQSTLENSEINNNENVQNNILPIDNYYKEEINEKRKK